MIFTRGILKYVESDTEHVFDLLTLSVKLNMSYTDYICIYITFQSFGRRFYPKWIKYEDKVQDSARTRGEL